jgi:hypothetical protein
MGKLTEKTFPIRMDNATYARLLKQAKRRLMPVTAYIRWSFLRTLNEDEASGPVVKPETQAELSKRRRR